MRRKAIESDTAGVAERTVATPQYVTNMIRDIGGHPAELIHGGARGVGVENHFHVWVTGVANVALVAPRRMVRAPPTGRWAVGRYTSGREELLTCYLVNRE